MNNRRRRRAKAIRKAGGVRLTHYGKLSAQFDGFDMVSTYNWWRRAEIPTTAIGIEQAFNHMEAMHAKGAPR